MSNSVPSVVYDRRYLKDKRMDRFITEPGMTRYEHESEDGSVAQAYLTDDFIASSNRREITEYLDRVVHNHENRMIKEFRCRETAGCRTFEKRFSNWEQYRDQFDAGQVKCPVCGAIPEPLVSATAPPKFNGSGFYATDYGRT